MTGHSAVMCKSCVAWYTEATFPEAEACEVCLQPDPSEGSWLYGSRKAFQRSKLVCQHMTPNDARLQEAELRADGDNDRRRRHAAAAGAGGQDQNIAAALRDRDGQVTVAEK